MRTKDVTVLVWDNPENFYSPETQRQFGNKSLYKAVKQFNSLEGFQEVLAGTSDSDLVVVCCHVNYKDYSGYWDFTYSEIPENYHLGNVIYLSSGDSIEVMNQIFQRYRVWVHVKLYNELVKELQHDEIKPVTKRSLLKNTLTEPPVSDVAAIPLSDYPQIDYAIITALYQDEFEQIRMFVDFPEGEIIRTATKEYHVGYLRTNRDIKVVAGIPSATGMVDSAIIATQMLEFFRPKYLIMSGVCGGRQGIAIGDIVIGKQFFTFQKGKISDLYTKTNPRGKTQKLDLYDKNGKVVEYDSLFDRFGSLVRISIERFEVEQDAIIEMSPILRDRIERNRQKLQDLVNVYLEPYSRAITMHIEPMACSTMVINKDGYFEERIKTVHRKTLAVEMESYAVARACQFANNGKTIPLIFKSVMDNTKNKDDDAKSFAARASALLLKEILENKVLG